MVIKYFQVNSVIRLSLYDSIIADTCKACAAHCHPDLHMMCVVWMCVSAAPPMGLDTVLSLTASPMSTAATSPRRGAGWLPPRILRAVWSENRGFLLDRSIFSSVCTCSCRNGSAYV